MKSLAIVLATIIVVQVAFARMSAATAPYILNLQQRAEAQYRAAATIVAIAPRTGGRVDHLIAGGHGPIGRFYAVDRKLQSDIVCINRGLYWNEMRGCLDLAEAEEFEYGAVSATASCNIHDAKLHLMVARAFLDEVSHDLRGSASPKWVPPDITNKVTNDARCEE